MARDRIGKKPLFYYDDGSHLYSPPRSKPFWQIRRSKKNINYEALYDYFQYLYIPDPKTIYKNVSKLKPGHYLVCDKNGIKENEYWDVSFANQRESDEVKLSQDLLDILEESVRLRMISDVPLGAFLSGGIDSSGVVALMSGQQKNAVTTCSIGFDAEEFDEIRYARTIADKFKTDHNEFTVRQDVKSILRDLVYHFDEPFADSSAVPTYYVSKLARQRVTVALSGDGGDENFAGYEKYHIDNIENRFRRAIPDLIRKPLFPFLSSFFSTRYIFFTRRTS